MPVSNARSEPDESTDAAAAAERRIGERHMTILRIGKLVTGGRQELCLIRNISSGGLMAHVYAPHGLGDRVEIELKSDERLSGEVIWVREGHIGVRFDGAIEISDILTHRPREDGRKSRPPRLDVSCRARLKVGADSHRVEIRDISQGGVKVEIEHLLEAGSDVLINVDGLDPMKGVVRWCRDGLAGLAFLRPIPFDALTGWLETHCTGGLGAQA